METWFKERQKLDPANPLIAHDTGLFHYRRAKNETDPQKAAVHWRRVIGNWVAVLENDHYWNRWREERQKVYGKTITHDHIAAAKKQLKEHMVLQLTEHVKNSPDPADVHLECEFSLEVKALRLVTRRGGFNLPAKKIRRMMCGPLLARQLELFSPKDDPFPTFRQTFTDKSRLVKNILAPLKLEDHRREAAVKYAENDRRLRLYFSQLGVPLIYLERGEPQRALNALGEPDRGSDLEAFPLLNPAYGFGPIGKQLFKQHAAQLNISARITLAGQMVLEEPADISSLVNHIREALELSRSIEIREELSEKVVQLMLSWADRLLSKEQWDQAIQLAESAGEFEKGEQWKGKLAGMLNVRGVKKAENQRWQQAVDDLERAHHLNPVVPLFRENLINAYQELKHNTCNYEKEQDIERRIAELRQGPSPKQGEPQEPGAPKGSKEPEVIRTRGLFFSEQERYHTNLFDEKGILNWGAFDDGGRAVIAGALEEAALRGDVLIDIPVIAAALPRCNNSQTLRLLELQGIDPGTLCFRTNGDSCKYHETRPLDNTSALTQFNLTLHTLGLLKLAWETAQSNHGAIGEAHILYGLLHDPVAVNQLKQAGTDVEQMRRQLSHDDIGD